MKNFACWKKLEKKVLQVQIIKILKETLVGWNLHFTIDYINTKK